MTSKVYFTDMHVRMGDSLLGKFDRLITRAGIEQIDFKDKFVAVKLHFGEVGNMAFLRQQYARVLCDHIKRLGGKPFLDRRVDEMFALGLADEFAGVRDTGYKSTDPGMQAIGYREFFMVDEAVGREQYLEEVRELIKKDTRHYAKKQLTFFRSMPDGTSFSMDETDAIRQKIECFFNANLQNT